MRTLEGRLNVRLFDRTPRRVGLTPAGAAFFDEVHETPLRLQRAAEAARRAAAGQTGRLAIGFVGALFGPELAQVFRRFRETRPEVRLELTDQVPADQLAAIADGRLDGGFIGLAPAEKVRGLRCRPWRTERLYAFVPPASDWARQRTLRLATLAQEAFVSVTAQGAPAFSAFFRRLCARAGFRPRVTHETDRAAAVVSLVVAGAGIAVLPESLRGVAGGAAVAVPLTDRSARVTFVFATRERDPSPELSAFVASLS